MKQFGRRAFGLAAIGFGLTYLIWGDFATVWQPVPGAAPLHTALVYVAAATMLIAGAALLFRKPPPVAGFVLTLIYAAFALLWVRQVIGAPMVEATWGSIAEDAALAAAALFVCLDADAPHAGRATRLRIAFGLCAIVFSLTHFTYPAATAGFVPGWFPGSGLFWAYATGFAHAAAGLALIAGFRPRLAAVGLTAMFAGFSLFVWLPRLFAAPTDHVAWTGNIMNLALVGAAWIVADALTSPAPETQPDPVPAEV